MSTGELEAETRRQWLLGLIDAGIKTQQQIDAGLTRCRIHNSPFLPSVGQFVTWCREAVEAENDLPSEIDARMAMNRELAKSPDVRDWTQYHPAVFWAYSQHGSFEWKQMANKDQRLAFAEVWTSVKRMLRQGFDFATALPKIEIEETESVAAPASKETATHFCGSILAMFPEGPEKGGVSDEI